MGNLYTGYTERELWDTCVADYRFYRNSLLNFRPNTIEGLGVGTDGEIFDQTDSPDQGKVCGLTSIAVEEVAHHFDFPDDFDTVLGEDTAFTIEYLGWPQDRAEGDYQALMGEAGSTDPYLGLNENNRVEIDFGAGAQQADTVEWVRYDSALHFVLTRAAGDDPDFTAYCNGTIVQWLAGGTTVAAGNNGFTDAAGEVFNHRDDTNTRHPFYGQHLALRIYNVALAHTDVRYLFKRIQRLVPHDMFHIPIWVER